MKSFYKRYILLIALVSNSFLVEAQFIVNSNGIPITNSATLSVNDAWQNSGAIVNNGTIITSANWVNTGTLVGSGGFVLNYSSNQNFTAGSNSSTIGFIEKYGVGNVIFSGKVYLADSLKIFGGLIQVSTNSDTLGLGTNPLVYVNTGSYVEGPMAKKGAGTFLLPVGLNGDYLPIKFHASTSARVGVKVDNAPPAGTYTAGDVVSSLINFPYEWKTTKSNPNDTASYVELQAPNALLGFDNLIVLRAISSTEYEGMGFKTRPDDGVNTAIRSYSKGLKGTFSIGVGFPGSISTDSASLRDFYDQTTGWTPQPNWLTNQVSNWPEVVVKGGRIFEIDLSDRSITGDVPDSFTEIFALKTLDLSTNRISKLPDLTSMPRLATVNVSSNNLDFADLEPIKDILVVDVGFYENQAPLTEDDEISEPVNQTANINVATTGSGNIYKWKFKPYYDDDLIDDYEDAPGINDQLNYTTGPLTRSTIGDYRLDITNTLVPNLTISSGDYTVEALADISGVFKFGEDGVLTSNRPTVFKEMRILQIVSGGYDTIQIQSVGAGGTFLFDDVKLRDYLITGFADTLRLPEYANAVASWFKGTNGTIYWEEADTIFLEDNIGDLNTPGLTIKSGVKPPDPNLGTGAISGQFVDPFNDESGRTNAKNKVSYGVSARRIDRAGRGTEDILELIAYVYTNEDGQFIIDGLDPDATEYRLNIQYPGYPMDPDSYIDILLNDNLFGRQVGVDAEIVEGKIEVRKLIITGWEEESHTLKAYPNPTVEYLFITGRTAQGVTFKLVDSNGRSMSVHPHWDNQENQWEFDVRDLKTGVYILQVKHQGKVENLRVVVK